PVALPGVDPVAGDWEAADMNSDGYVDLVALGTDGGANAALSVFSGSAAGWTRDDVDVYASATLADVDLGDFDADGLPDAFVMCEDAGLNRVSKVLTHLPGAAYATAAAATSADHQIAFGDGFIVDTANDARSEIVSMGTDAAGDISGFYLRTDQFVNLQEATQMEAMTVLEDTDTTWGDFDNDADLDACQIGHDPIGWHLARYENALGDYIDQNDAPLPPTNLTSVRSAALGGYTFSWSAPANTAAIHDETPATGFGYELRIGTTQNGVQILSWAHPAGASQQGTRMSRF